MVDVARSLGLQGETTAWIRGPNVEVTGPERRLGREAEDVQTAPRGRGGMPSRIRLTDMLGVAVCLHHVLDAWWHGHPAVHALLVDRERGTRKLRVGERTDRNCDRAFKVFGCVEHR